MSKNTIQTIRRRGGGMSRERKKPPQSFKIFSILTNSLPSQGRRVTGCRRSTHRYPSCRRSRRIQAHATSSPRKLLELSSTLNLYVCDCQLAVNATQSNNNAALTSQNSAPPPHSAHPKSPNSWGTAPSPGSRSSRPPSPLHTPRTAAASRHAVPP